MMPRPSTPVRITVRSCALRGCVLLAMTSCAAQPPASGLASSAPVQTPAVPDELPLKLHATAPYLLHVKCPHVPDPLPGEVPPAPAGPRQTLEPGHWNWVDGSYVWSPPQWHPRPGSTVHPSQDPARQNGLARNDSVPDANARIQADQDRTGQVQTDQAGSERHQTWQDGYWEANGGACVWHNGRFLLAPLS